MPRRRNSSTELVKTGKDAGNVFDLKQKELVAAKTGANVVTENRALAQEFEKEVASLRTRSEAAAATAVRESEAEIRQGRIILISLALVSLATALVIGWLLCRPRGGAPPRAVCRTA